MIKTCSYLFVYGTLLDKQNEFGEYLSNNCVFFADGKMPGKLYDMGEYPGAILAPGDNYVYGKIHKLNDIDKVLEILDDYEGFGPEQAQPNLFIRRLIDIETVTGKIECWAYLYNLQVDGFNTIGSGIYPKVK